MSMCCRASLDYSRFDATIQEEFRSLDPSPQDNTFTCDDVEKLMKEPDKHLKFMNLAIRFSANAVDWFRFHYPREFGLGEEPGLEFGNNIGIVPGDDNSTEAKVCRFLEKYGMALRQSFLDEKRMSAKFGRCAGACVTYSSIVAQLLREEYGIAAEVYGSNNLWHFWVEFQLDDGRRFILDPTADQFDIQTEADLKNTITPVIIPRDEVERNPYLKFLYGTAIVADTRHEWHKGQMPTLTEVKERANQR